MRVTSSGPRRRGGVTLVELLVALPVAMLVAAAAALLLLQLTRSARAQSSSLANARELRHARLVLAADLEPLRGRELIMVHDTVLEFHGQLGVLILCATPTARTLEIAAPARTSDAWVPVIRSGDEVRLWRASPEPAAPPAPVVVHVTGTPTPLAGTGCGTDTSGVTGRWRLPVADSAPAGIPGLISVHRRLRYRHYRSGSAWWLGRQAFDGVQWDGVQPVAGPLLGAAEQGVRIAAQDSAGALVPIQPGTSDSLRARAVLLTMTLRMARRVRERWAPSADSVSVRVPLRTSGSGWHP